MSQPTLFVDVLDSSYFVKCALRAGSPPRGPVTGACHRGPSKGLVTETCRAGGCRRANFFFSVRLCRRINYSVQKSVNPAASRPLSQDFIIQFVYQTTQMLSNNRGLIASACAAVFEASQQARRSTGHWIAYRRGGGRLLEQRLFSS